MTRLVAVLLLVVPSLASAQPGMTPPGTTPPSPVQPGPGPVATTDDGLHFLFSGSAGVALREDGGFAGSLSSGFYYGKRTAAIAELALIARDCTYTDTCTDEVTSIVMLGAGIRHGLGERFWIQGTVGIAGIDLRDDTSESGLGWTSLFAMDLFRGPRAAVDMRLGLIGAFGESYGPVRGFFTVGLTL